MIMIYTGSEADLNELDLFEKDYNRIEVVEDGAGIKHIPLDVIECPIFAELTPIFERLTPVPYTPHPPQIVF